MLEEKLFHYDERIRLEEYYNKEKPLISPENAIYFLQQYCHTWDTETDHVRADEILCKVLTKLGYEHIVSAYHQVHKWHC